MSFQRLQIRYQTARSLPAPYAYFYTLTAQPAGEGEVKIDISITYPDRDGMDEDELIAEGFTRDDNLSWSGRLPKNWADALISLTRNARLQPLDEDALGEEDDFWEIRIESGNGSGKQGVPQPTDAWQYTVQELIQAVYERMNRERPFELIYLDNGAEPSERRLTASFAERTINLLSSQNQREQSRPLPWSVLQPLMGKVYEQDFDPDKTQTKRPARAGQWLNLGSEEWYDIRLFKGLTRFLTDL